MAINGKADRGLEVAAKGITEQKPDRRCDLYIEEHRQFLEANAKGRSYELLAVSFNQEFGTNIGRLTISKLCRRFGISNGSTSRRPYSDEEIEFLRQNVSGVDYTTLAKMLNERFDRNINADRVGELCRRKGFTNGLDNRYKPGHTVNIGRRLPHAAPDGTEYVNAAGYVMLKHNGVWRYKHIVIWEQANGKSVPKGHFIIFGDSDKCNFSAANLFCVTASQSGMRNAMGLQGATAELAAVGVALARLYLEVGGRKGRRKGKFITQCR